MSVDVVSSLLNHARDRVAAHRENGLSFNVFDILNVARKEVRCHSAFISALLDPSGVLGLHGQRDLFLRQFFIALAASRSDLAGDLPDLTGGWHVFVERTCHVKDGRQGRIDILLGRGDRWVVIENKIDAGDQEGQLHLYATHAKESRKRCVLVYLTLTGSRPSTSSLLDLPVDKVVCISYRETIAAWLQECIELVSAKPALSELLRQYGRLVRRLSEAGLSPDLTMELLTLLRSPDNLEAAAEIVRALPKARAQVQFDFWEDLRGSLAALNETPVDLIRDFSPTLARIVKTPGGNREFGYCFPLFAPTATRQVALLARPRDNLYFVFAAVENGTWVSLTAAEVENIRNTCDSQRAPYELRTSRGDKDDKVIEYVNPHYPLNFMEFGSREASLADPKLRKEIARIIAEEIASLASLVRNGLRTDSELRT